jgi:TRAP-type uncharacterized transport system fused permease subunit
VIGILYWAYGLEGHFHRDLGVFPRALLIAAGVMLIWPSFWVSLAGLVLGGAVLAPRHLARNADRRGFQVEG